MIPEERLKDVLHGTALSRKDKVLLALASPDVAPKLVGEVKAKMAAAGLRSTRHWNIPDILSKPPRAAVRGNSGWELNTAGKQRVEAITGHAAPSAQAATSIRAHLSRISDADTVSFLDEAISCLETGLKRAAVVLSWVGAVSVLYKFVVGNHLSAFNAEALKRDAKWRPAKNPDGLARMKEHDFLDVLEAIGAIGKNVKQELQTSLTLRNACGHPNSLVIGENRVAAHIEILVLNVFAKY